MIKYIQIENFKSLKRISLPLENLNLFFGMNGMGKSSVIQSLLLLRQSYWENHPSGLQRLYTNGDLVSLGTGEDVLCQSSSEEDRIRFYIQYTDDLKYDCQYKVSEKSDQLERECQEIEEKYNTSLLGDDFWYLGAEHLGPKKEYSMEKWKKEGVNELGNCGEFVVPFLAMKGEKIIGKLQILQFHVWCQSDIQISNSFFIFVDCNKLLSPGLVPLPVSSFPQHVSHGSGIFNIFESPRQFQCYSFLFQCLGFHLIFWTPPKGWHHFSSSALCSTLSSG